MSAAGRCIHPDCIYRNRGDPDRTGNCNYFSMTGTCRIPGLQPKQQEPENCPRYVPDGTTCKAAGESRKWREVAEKLYNAGHTDHEIADAVGVSYSAVQKWRRDVLDRDPNPDKKQSGFSWERARDLYLIGLNDREIADKLGCSVSSVWRWRSKYSLFPNGKIGTKRRDKNHEAQSTGEPLQ